jgi:hypothetical protein
MTLSSPKVQVVRVKLMRASTLRDEFVDEETRKRVRLRYSTGDRKPPPDLPPLGAARLATVSR